jgi:hypothetical protein
MLSRERTGWPADRHDEVWAGTIRIDGSDVVHDRLLRSADEPGRVHDHLDKVHGLPGLFVQAKPEITDELIENQVASVQRMQHQDLLYGGLRLAQCRRDGQQAAQYHTPQFAANAAIWARTHCQAAGLSHMHW